jgi:hypothetical protein
MNARFPLRRRVRVLPGGHSLLLALLLLLAAPPAIRPAVAQDDGGGAGESDGKKDGKEDGKKGGKAKDKEKEEERGKDKEKGKDKGKGDGRTEEESAKTEAPKKTEEEKLLESLGASWKAGDAKAVAAKLPRKRKTSLRLPGSEEGEYRAEQAKSVLERYFSERSFTKVTLKSVKEATGTFQVEYVVIEERRRVTAELLLVIGTEEKERCLVGVRESP